MITLPSGYFMRSLIALLLLCHPVACLAQAAPVTAWDSVGRVMGTSPVAAPGYTRFNFPRRDVTLRVGDVTVSPSLALGAWAGFSGTPANAIAMGDLVVTSDELKPVLAELSRQGVDVTSVHNHLAGDTPHMSYVHFHAHGGALDIARRLDKVLARTATPRPVAPTTPAAVTIDTALVFSTLGASGRAQGAVAQVSLNLVGVDVSMHGAPLVAALAYASPLNVQLVDANRAVATGDFAVLQRALDPLLDALAAHGITATAVHSHLVGESPAVYYVHFWADAPLADVVRGLRAAVDATK